MAASRSLSTAEQDVLDERRRQIDVEGWSADHDDKHRRGEIAMAAIAAVLRMVGLGS